MKTLLKPFLLLALLFSSSVFAQPALYVEGTHYETIAKPVRTADPAKIEVAEVFWYGCRTATPSNRCWKAGLPSCRPTWPSCAAPACGTP